jgi:hypothetical protein
LIDTWSNLIIKMSKLPQDSGSQFPLSKFRASKEPVSFHPTAWLFNKKKKHVSELLNLHLIWLHETGLFSRIPYGKPEHGILLPCRRPEPCPDPHEGAAILNAESEQESIL